MKTASYRRAKKHYIYTFWGEPYNMTYEAIARKYRPQTFESVIGQEHIVTTIANSISQKRIHHAYLFSGSRGTGKTTMARLLAKALNCFEGPTTKLCQKCDACVGISNGNFVDVQEIDGASNRGIDEIRNLRENVKFAPVSGKYKIYIIDEAHQITGAAFNALLKTLEEPPPHAIFILATTEAQSIPPTIASRCQKYHFRLIPTHEIAGALKKILESEKISADEEAIRLIAEAAAGSMRDAQSLLDQSIAFCGQKLTTEKIKELLGILPEEFIYETFLALEHGDSKKIIHNLEQMTSSGHDLSHYVSQMLFYLRQLLLVKSGVSISPAESSQKIIEKFKDKFSTEQILRFSKMLLKAKEEMRWSDDTKFLLELYLVKLTQPFLDSQKLARALENVSADDIPKVAEASKSQDFSAAASDETALAHKDISSFWKDFISSLPSSEMRLKNVLENTKLKKMEETELEIEAFSEFIMSELNSKKKAILEFLKQYSGKNFTITYTLSRKSKVPLLQENSEIIEDESENSGSIFWEPSTFTITEKPVASRSIKEKPRHTDGIKKILEVFNTDKIEKLSDN